MTLNAHHDIDRSTTERRSSGSVVRPTFPTNQASFCHDRARNMLSEQRRKAAEHATPRVTKNELRHNIPSFTLREVLVLIFRVLLSPPEEDVPRHNNPTRPLIS